MLVAQGHVDHALVDPGGHGGDRGGLLAAALGARGDEEAEVLALQGAVHPQLAEAVDEGLPLRGEVAVAGGHAEEEGVVLREGVGLGEGNRGVLRGGVHLGGHFAGEGFFDSGRGRVVVSD